MPTWDGDDWVPLHEAIERAPACPGAYVIRCAPCGKPKPIDRAFASDPTGVLLFGETVDLSDRLTTFFKAASGKGAEHSEGKRYHELEYDRLDRFPLNSLQARWQTCETKTKAKAQKNAWFQEYLDIYGELPPLNRQGPKPTPRPAPLSRPRIVQCNVAPVLLFLTRDP